MTVMDNGPALPEVVTTRLGTTPCARAGRSGESGIRARHVVDDIVVMKCPSGAGTYPDRRRGPFIQEYGLGLRRMNPVIRNYPRRQRKAGPGNRRRLCERGIL